MREFSAPVARVVGKEENLTNMVWVNAEQFPATVSFRRQINSSWLNVTTKEFAEQVLGVTKGLIVAGLRPGERVGLMSKTRYEWTLLNYAIWAAGCVTVPIYQTSATDQVEWTLADSSAKAVFVETSAQHSIVSAMRERFPKLYHVWQIEGPPDDESGAVTVLTKLGDQISDEEVHVRRQAIIADDTAALIYTSGTTGQAKGCVITHRNFLAEAYADNAAFPDLVRQGNSTLMFLPMAHVLAYAIMVAWCPP
ncbi:MAG: AMP-binding protein [Pseudonocardiaceae bacterium]